MRLDSVQFSQANESPQKSPRFVVSIMFDTASIYCTSHNDITSVPGVVLNSVLQEPSAISQRLAPDQGLSEIGSFSFKLVDLNSAFTAAIKSKLDGGAGMKGRTVRFFVGFEGFDFTSFQLFTTQIVTDASEDHGSYTVQCQDLTREQRVSLFEPKYTTLQASCSATDTTINVYSTTDFQTVVHGTSWSDGPGGTYGYFRIEDEVIRYTGKTPASFTGCTRGVLNTRPVAHAVDAAAAAERRTKVEEYIYLELPAVKMAYAILTGILYGSSNTLPDHWHLGIDTPLIRWNDFFSIGTDLWNPADDAAGVILRFEGLKKTDGKRFLETEIYLLLGAYSPIYADGSLGLRRLPALLSDAAPVATLTSREILSHDDLQHDLSGMHNVFRVNWNWDVLKEDFTRITLFQDSGSIAIHGESKLFECSFKGLHGSRITDALIRTRLDTLRDAYSHPPQRTSLQVTGSLSKLEVGDVVRDRYIGLRDFAGNGVAIDRAFLILNKSFSTKDNRVKLDLLGSTARPDSQAPTAGPTAPLPDAYYSSVGTALSVYLTIVANVVQPGSYILTGSADMNSAASIFYHLGDLTIADGAVITIVGNVQIRVRGFLTLNGDIVGTAGGWAGVADPSSGSWDTVYSGNAGYVGNSRGFDGILYLNAGGRALQAQSISLPLTRGLNDAFPYLDLKVAGTLLSGIPSDLRGGGGGPGGRAVNFGIGALVGFAAGGTGGTGGAGLVIVCRGMGLGASASITLNGANGGAGSSQNNFSRDWYSGTGGAGAPGAMLILLDGNSLSIPDITGKFFAVTGSITQAGTALLERKIFGINLNAQYSSIPSWAGYSDPAAVSAADWSNAAHRIQYVPETLLPAIDQTEKPAAPTGLAATATGNGNALLAAVDLHGTDELEIWASINNDRANALLINRGTALQFMHNVPVLATFWYWSRVRHITTENREAYSDWFPVSSTAGIGATSLTSSWSPVYANGGTARMELLAGGRITKVGGSAAWDSGVYSVEGYTNGAEVTFRTNNNNTNLMIGLNADPANDASYTSIDFAFYLDSSGVVLVYESGSPINIGNPTYTIVTVFSIRWDGRVLRYYMDGQLKRAVPLTDRLLFLDSSFYDPGSSATIISYNTQTGIQTATGNMLNLATWLIGAGLTTDVGNFVRSQTVNGECEVVLAGTGTYPLGPYGQSEPIWKCVSNEANAAAGDGGWVNRLDLYGIDSAKTYRSAVAFYYDGVASGYVYLGCDQQTTVDLNGTPNDNPYFIAAPLAGLTAGKWYWILGFIHGSGFGTVSSGLSGIYDPETGAIIAIGNEFKNTVGARFQTHRSFLFYCGDPTTRLFLAKPRFEEVNGTEPSILSILNRAGIAMIPPNTATDVMSLTVPGTISIAGTSFSSGVAICQLTIPAQLFDYDAVCTVQGIVINDGSAVGATFTSFVTISIGSPTLVGADSYNEVLNTAASGIVSTRARFTVETRFNFGAGNARTVYVAGLGLYAPGGAYAAVEGVTFKIEVIKR